MGLKVLSMLNSFDPTKMAEGDILVYLVKKENGEIVESIELSSKADGLSRPSEPVCEGSCIEQVSELSRPTVKPCTPTYVSKEVERPKRSRGTIGNTNAGSPAWTEQEHMLAQALDSEQRYTREEIARMLEERGFPRRTSNAVSSKLNRK